jgi:hypothetical protein
MMTTTSTSLGRTCAALSLAAAAVLLASAGAQAQGTKSDWPFAPSGSTPGSTPAPQIVNANEKVKATKRGVCENHLSQEDFMALSKGVSWYYNWAPSTSDVAPNRSGMEYLPMAWGRDGDIAAVQRAVAGNKPRAILCLNEPNLKGQAFLTPEATANYYKQIKEVADRHKVPLVGPNMALGSSQKDSISAEDPITKKMTTYTAFPAFLEAFLSFTKKAKVETGMMGTHSYKDMNELRWAVDKTYEVSGNKPVWVTEFAFWDAKDEAEELKYLRTAVEFLEGSRKVAGYAWFKERVDRNPKLSLLEKQSGKLTPLGEEYVKLPSHAANVFYRIPGQIEAGKYVETDNMTLRPTTDLEGDYDMESAGSSSVAYNIHVDVPGTYTVKLRVSGSPGKIDITQDGRTLGSVQSTQLLWHTVETPVTLAAGSQTVRVHANGQALHFVEFVAQPLATAQVAAK